MVPGVREKQREETRRRLYEAALEVFRRDGVQTCRIDDIARIAEVSRAAFYFHFPTKDAVLLQLAHEGEEQLLKALEALPADHTLLQLLETVAGAQGTFWKDKRELVADAYGAVLRAIATVSDAEYFQSRNRFAGQLKRLQDKGLAIRDFAPEVMAESVLSSVMIIIIGWVRTPEAPLEQHLKKAAQVFLRSLKPD